MKVTEEPAQIFAAPRDQVTRRILYKGERGEETMTDGELLELHLARDREATAALERKYGAYCAAIARNILADERDVEECLSDCWLQVWNAAPSARPEHFKGWLGAVVRNRALAIRRRRAREPDTVDEAALELAAVLPAGDTVHGEAEARELGEAVSRFLREQEPAARAAFLRRYWYADSLAAVARHMGWSQSKTKSVLFRVRNRLREYLNKEGYL